MGRSQEAIQETHCAYELDPISVAVRGRGLWHLFISRRYEETIEACRKVVQLEPNYPWARASWDWRTLVCANPWKPSLKPKGRGHLVTVQLC
jgi:hypothetical protein